MKKLLALILALSVSSVSAQTLRGRRSQTTRRGVSTPNSTRRVSTPLPVFLSRQGVATITEMMIQPPAFSYGSSINVWLVKDKSKQTREISVTGHADSSTCRKVSGQVMRLFIDKHKQPEDLFVAGAANMVDRGDPNEKRRLLRETIVQEFIDAEEDLWDAKYSFRSAQYSPREGKDGESALDAARKVLMEAQLRVDELRTNDLVKRYLRETESAKAINNFVDEIRDFSRENGLVNVHEIPLELIEKARARIADVAASSQSEIVSFDDLLQTSGMREAAVFTPVVTVPGGRPVELRIPFASVRTPNFAEAQRTNRNELEQALVGNANDRLAVFKKTKADRLRQQDDCSRATEEELDQTVVLDWICTADGICYKPDKPQKITRREYCKVNVPLSLKLTDIWIEETEQLLKRIEDDAEREDGSRIQELEYATLVDSMLRDWRLPVPRSQEAFDRWRGVTRNPVWRLLKAQLTQMGIASDVIGGEQMVFSVKLDHQTLVVQPIHVIDMARSVLVADPKSGATRVLDAWSMRSQKTAETTTLANPAAEVQSLIRDAIKLLAEGDSNGAEAQIAAAFSRDPATAFRTVEREWLQQFPDTRQRMLSIQESLKSMIEALEWKEGFENVRFDPSSKDAIRESVEAFQTFLKSYPRAPVDLYLEFAMKLAEYLATWQNELNRRNNRPSPPLSAWDVLQAHITGEAGIARGIGGATIPTKNRDAVEAYLREKGYRGKRLQKALAAQISVLTSARAGTSNTSFLDARSILSLQILADPTPLIREALEVVVKRQPDYWVTALQARGRPKERSLEWKAADKATERELTLFESNAQSLVRLEDQLRKSFSGSAAADSLVDDRRTNLPQTLSFINAAVGDGRTGSSPAFLAPQQTVKLFIEQRRIMTLLTRLENSGYLRRGSEELLAIARSRIADRARLEAFRDAIPLRANLWFESGNYIQALDALLPPEIPIALYSPTLSWRSLPGDAVKKPLSITARLDGSRVFFEATFTDERKVDVLVLEGLSPLDAKALQEDFSKIAERMAWSEIGSVSEQILSTSVALRPALGDLRDLLIGPKLRMLLVKSMVYGRNAPGSDLVQQSSGQTVNRVVASVDKVNGDEGRTYEIPLLNEVKQLAQAKARQ